MPNISLEGTIDISRVGIIYDELKSSLEQSATITLDISQLEQIDGAGVQLLYAYLTTAKKRDIDITLTQPSDAVLSAIDTLGLTKEFHFS